MIFNHRVIVNILYGMFVIAFQYGKWIVIPNGIA